MKNTIIITGGAGFIGQNLIETLVKKYKIINIDNFSLKFPFKRKKYKNLKTIKCSIGNKKKIEKIIRKFKPKYIFNLASETHVDVSINKPGYTIKNNVLNSYFFFETVKNNLKFLNKNFRFIQISTDEVYGSIGKYSNKKFTELSNLETNSPYSASKASCDLILNSFYKTFNFPVIITRGCNNFGEYQHFEKLIPKTIRSIIKKREIPIYDKGAQVREWIYSKDHCKMLDLISKKGKIGNIYNIGSGYKISNLKLVIKILRYMKIHKNIKHSEKNLIKFVKDRPGHDFKYSLDTSKINKIKRFNFKSDFDQKLFKTIDWYLKSIK